MPTSTYWDERAADVDGLPVGWRRHSRAAHRAWAAEHLAGLGGPFLKTDLQEEAAAERSFVGSLDGDWCGIDVSPAVARRARPRFGGPRLASDVRALPFRSGSFGAVLSTSTLDHFEERESIEASLAELGRVLRPGGRLLLTLDNPANPLVRLRNALPPAVAARTGLVPFFVGHTLEAEEGRRLLERLGFAVVAVDHLLHAPHVVGTRLARFRWFERRALPWFDRLGGTRLGRRSGHFVAFVADRR